MNHRRGILHALVVGAAGPAAVVLFWARTSAATPDFPAAVDAYLDLPNQVEDTFPTMGCTLCHPTESPPASNPPLQPFGQLLFSNGAMPYDVASLNAALAAVDTMTPSLIADLKAGRNPNTDSAVPSGLPTPETGCSMRPAAPARAPLSWAASAALFSLVLVRRVSKSRRTTER